MTPSKNIATLQLYKFQALPKRFRNFATLQNLRPYRKSFATLPLYKISDPTQKVSQLCNFTKSQTFTIEDEVNQLLILKKLQVACNFRHAV